MRAFRADRYAYTIASAMRVPYSTRRSPSLHRIVTLAGAARRTSEYDTPDSIAPQAAEVYRHAAKDPGSVLKY